MKDYASMSDFEINKAVAMALLDKSANPSARYVAIGDYCNSPADAWPIMMANNIGIEKDFDLCCGECGSYYDTGLWIASAADRDLEVKHRSALRAAMIVFMMMKEGEL